GCEACRSAAVTFTPPAQFVAAEATCTCAGLSAAESRDGYVEFWRAANGEQFCSEFCADDAEEARFRVQHTAPSSGATGATATHSAQLRIRRDGARTVTLAGPGIRPGIAERDCISRSC